LSHKKERRLTFNLCRESPFSFTCRACSRCCRGKVILVGPHEILGMSRALGIDTTELLSRYTNQGGTALRTTEDGRCVFVLDRLGFSSARPIGRTIVAPGPARRADPGLPKKHNRLCALNLAQEGKVQWMVGDEDGEEEPRLAEAFFLETPLVRPEGLFGEKIIERV